MATTPKKREYELPRGWQELAEQYEDASRTVGRNPVPLIALLMREHGDPERSGVNPLIRVATYSSIVLEAGLRIPEVANYYERLGPRGQTRAMQSWLGHKRVINAMRREVPLEVPATHVINRNALLALPPELRSKQAQALLGRIASRQEVFRLVDYGNNASDAEAMTLVTVDLPSEGPVNLVYREAPHAKTNAEELTSLQDDRDDAFYVAGTYQHQVYGWQYEAHLGASQDADASRNELQAMVGIPSPESAS